MKPANILVECGRDNRLKIVKLADFGIAKAVGESTSLTSSGVTVGTMAYISPEALEGRILDNRADIYSLACTAFELLTGAPPFTAGNLAALIAAHSTQAPPSITARRPGLPDYLDAVFERALAKNPDSRFQSCMQLVEALGEPRAAVV
ncbi:serine/threonine protein kinase, partial [Mycobacterium avium subsp. hominissuis]